MCPTTTSKTVAQPRSFLKTVWPPLSSQPVFYPEGAAGGGIDIFTKDMNIEYRERRSITIIQDGNSELVKVQNDFWQDMDNDFIDAVRKGDDSALKITYADAVKTQEVVMAVNRSIETGEVVQISDM